jgi:hypothetical protein
VNEYCRLSHGQRLEVGQHALILLDLNGNGGNETASAMALSATALAVPPTTEPSSVSKRTNSFSTPNFALENSAKVLAVRQAAVEQTVDWLVEIVNTSHSTLQNERVASFLPSVAGVGVDWEVTTQPPELLLSHSLPTTTEDAQSIRGQFRITIKPPRVPASRAGLHEFTLRITSKEFSGEALTIPLKMMIAPYLAWEVSKLTPTHLYSRSRSPVETHLTLTNRSNAPVRIETAGITENLPAQVTFVDKPSVAGFETTVEEIHTKELSAGDRAKVYIRAMPQRPHWFGRERRYTLVVTPKVVALDGKVLAEDERKAVMEDARTKEVRGEFFQQARLGYLDLALFFLTLFLLFIGALFFLRPRIQQFALVDGPKAARTPDVGTPTPIPPSVSSAPKYVVAGTQLLLDLDLPFVSHFTIDRLLDNGREEPVLTADWPLPTTTPYTLTVRNGESATYRIRGTNWIANLPLLGLWGVAEQRVRLEVAPVIASLSTKVDTTKLAAQSPLTLTWQVSESNMQVTLLENNQPRPITGTTSLTGTFGKLLRTPLTDTVYQIQAQSPYPHEPVSSPPLAVQVIPPTPTVVPTPNIRRFEVFPPQLVAGQKVTVLYDVPDAGSLYLLLDDMQIAQLQPPAGLEEFVLDQPKRYRVTIRALGRPTMTVGAESTRWHTVEVLPLPTAPQIELFKVSPETVTRGSESAKNITLLWTVVGEVQNIRILSADKLIAANLPMSGTLKLAAENSTSYQLWVEGKDSPIQSAVATLTVADSSLVGGSPAGEPPAGGSLAEQLQKQQLPPPTLQISKTINMSTAIKISDCQDQKKEITTTKPICLFIIGLPVPAVSVTLVGVKRDGDQCTQTLWKQWGYADIFANKLTYQCGECVNGTFTVYAEDNSGTVRQAQQTSPSGGVPLACK